MAWICLVASEDSQSLLHLGCELSPTVSASPTPKQSYSVAKLPGTWMLRPSGMTLRLSPDFGCPTWISFTGDSPARTSALRETAEAWKASEADYFLRYAALSTKSSRRLSFWKTSRPLGHAAVNEWGKNWLREGMI